MIVRLCFVLCLAAHLGTAAEVTVENNAYHGLVVSFAPEINSEEGKKLIDNLKGLLERTSDALHTAIGVRIADVAFHLPSAWDTSTWESVTVHPAPTPLVGKEDILVEHVADSAFGSHPFALQYGGCTVPGHKILVQTAFLDGDNEGYPKEKLLAREWLKYRYGVFDENGFKDDDMYPSYYQTPGVIGVEFTDCTDPAVLYDMKNSTGDGYCTLEIPFVKVDCHVHPREEFLNVTSSLMYFHEELKAMETVCGKDHPHKKFTPSKHNLLCNEKSIWEVLEKSSDFKNEETTVEPPQYEEEHGIVFSYLQETKPRVVVAFENSIKLHYQGDMILFAIRRLVEDLPDGSAFGLYNYDDNTEPIRSISPLTTDNRGLNIPEMFTNEPTEICITCAVSEAAKALADQPQIQGSVILIGDSTSFDAEENLVNKLKELELDKHNLCLTLVAFTNTPQQNEPAVFKDLDGLLKCITLVVIHKEETVSGSTFDELYPVLNHAVPHTPTTSQTSTVVSGIISSDISLDIPMDVTSDKYTLWLPKLLQSNSIQCQSGDNAITLTPGVQRSDIASYSFAVAEVDVNCKLRSRPSPIVVTPYFAHVERTTKSGEYFEEEVWIHDTSEPNGEQMPVIIYARINFGNYPVHDARVVASITGPNEETLELELFDNGRGDPDITKNDGIYSRYFVGLTEAGTYQVTVTAENGNSTKVGKSGEDGCCGSIVKSESVELQHRFRRSTVTSFSTKGGKPELGYKPSRILDLRVHNYNPMESITLKWTAPGGEGDNGKVATYILKSFTKREDLLSSLNEGGLSINVSNVPLSYGGEEEFPLPHDDFEHGTTHYLAMLSVNSDGKVSDISNTLEIYLPEDPTKEDEATTVDPNPGGKQSGMNKQTIGIIIGCLVLVIVLVIVVYLLVYFFVRKPRRKEAKKTMNQGNHASPPPISLNSIPADVILKHHNEVVSARSQHKDPPIFKEENLYAVEQAPELPESSPPETPKEDRSNNSAEYSQVQKRRPEQENVSYPPKSPKRMTNV